MSMDVLRIRLEGAVELLGAARADFEGLEASLPRWEDELPLQRARLDARLAEEARLAEALDGRPLGLDVPEALVAEELSRLEGDELAALIARLARVPGCAAFPLSNLWCKKPDAQGNVVFHLGAGDNWFVLEPERARRVEAMMRGASPRDVG